MHIAVSQHIVAKFPFSSAMHCIAMTIKGTVWPSMSIYSALPTSASFVPEAQASKYVSTVTWDGTDITATAQGEAKITGSTDRGIPFAKLRLSNVASASLYLFTPNWSFNRASP